MSRLHLFLSVPGPSTHTWGAMKPRGREGGRTGATVRKGSRGAWSFLLPLVLRKEERQSPAAPPRAPPPGTALPCGTGAAAADTCPGPSPADAAQTLPRLPLCVCALRGRRGVQHGPRRQLWGWAVLPFGPKLMHRWDRCQAPNSTANTTASFHTAGHFRGGGDQNVAEGVATLKCARDVSQQLISVPPETSWGAGS